MMDSSRHHEAVAIQHTTRNCAYHGQEEMATALLTSMALVGLTRKRDEHQLHNFVTTFLK